LGKLLHRAVSAKCCPKKHHDEPSEHACDRSPHDVIYFGRENFISKVRPISLATIQMTPPGQLRLSYQFN
jgi:hypothetical protein